MGLFKKLFGKKCVCCGKPADKSFPTANSKKCVNFCNECLNNAELLKHIKKLKGAPEKRTIEELYAEVLKDPNPYLLKDIEYPSEYPVFKFFPNPLKTSSVIKSAVPCECCGKSGRHSYAAAFYRNNSNLEDVKNLCLNCIANGEAARKFDGVFTPKEAIANRTANKAVTEEIMYRTPSFNTWQEQKWLSHCKTPCSYVGQVYIGDLLKMGVYKQVRTELAKTFYYQKMPMTTAEIDDMLLQMTEGSSLEGHLFKCSICGKYKLHTDLD